MVALILVSKLDFFRGKLGEKRLGHACLYLRKASRCGYSGSHIFCTTYSWVRVFTVFGVSHEAGIKMSPTFTLNVKLMLII